MSACCEALLQFGAGFAPNVLHDDPVLYDNHFGFTGIP